MSPPKDSLFNVLDCPYCIYLLATLIKLSATFMLGYWFMLQLISGSTTSISSTEGGIAFGHMLQDLSLE